MLNFLLGLWVAMVVMCAAGGFILRNEKSGGWTIKKMRDVGNSLYYFGTLAFVLLVLSVLGRIMYSPNF